MDEEEIIPLDDIEEEVIIHPVTKKKSPFYFEDPGDYTIFDTSRDYSEDSSDKSLPLPSGSAPIGADDSTKS